MCLKHLTMVANINCYILFQCRRIGKVALQVGQQSELFDNQILSGAIGQGSAATSSGLRVDGGQAYVYIIITNSINYNVSCFQWRR